MIFLLDLFIVVMSLFFVKMAKIKLTQINPISLHLVMFFTYLYIGTTLTTFANLTQNDFLLSISCSENYLLSNLIVNILLISFSFGIFVSSLINRGYNVLVLERYYGLKKNNNIKTDLRFNEQLLFLLLSLSLFLMFATFLSMFFQYKSILLNNSLINVKYKMITSGGWYYIFPLYGVINPLLFVIFLYLYLSSRKKRYFYLILVSFLLQFTSTITGFRTYVFDMTIYLLSIYSLYRHINVKYIIYIVNLMVIGFLGLSFLKYDDSKTLLVILGATLHRLFLETGCALEVIYAYLAHKSYLIGESYIWDLISKLPGRQRTLGGVLAEEAGWDFFGTLTPTIAGELYINFGFFAFLIYFAFGFLLYKLYVKLMSFFVDRNSLKITLFYYLLIVFSMASVVGGFTVYFFSIVSSVVIFMLLVAYTFLLNLLRYKKSFDVKNII